MTIRQHKRGSGRQSAGIASDQLSPLEQFRRFAGQFFSLPDPPATRQFKAGDRVDTGFGEATKSVVKETYDNGKLLLVEQNADERDAGGHKTGSRVTERIVRPWTDVFRLIPEAAKHPAFGRKDEIRLDSSTKRVSEIVHTHYGYGIDYDAPYQRGLGAWSAGQKQRLIGSMFNNYDIGKFVMNVRPYQETRPLYDMIDGKHRLNAIIEFFEDRFRYEGVLFSELGRFDRLHLVGFTANVSEGRELTLEQQIQCFLKVNVAGTPQDPEHIERVKLMLEQIRESGWTAALTTEPGR